MNKAAALVFIWAFSACGHAQISELGAAPQRSAKDIIVVFRYDDFSDRSNTEAESAIFAAFRKHGLKLTVGVVPFPSDGRFVDPAPQGNLELSDYKTRIIREAIEAGVVEPALHGYSHQTTRGKWEGGFTEFDGVAYETQLRKIRLGRAYLEQRLGRRIDIFVPPFNTYDLNTLRALDETGFRVIAADVFGPADGKPRPIILPFTCYTRELKAVVEAARRFSEPQPLIVVFFHDSDFLEVDKRRGWTTYDGLDELMGWVAAQPDIRVLSLAGVLEQIEGIDSERFAAFREFGLSTRWLPPFLIPLEARIYLPAETSRSLAASGWMFTAAYLFAVFVIAFGLAFGAGVLLFRGRLAAHVLYLGGAVAAAVIAALGAVYLMYDFKGPLAIALAVGSILGALPAYLSALKKTAGARG